MISASLIGPEIWLKVHSYFPEWSHNPCTLLKLSSVCRSAEVAFLSDTVWKHLNPYGLSHGISSHFLTGISYLNPLQKKNLAIVWYQTNITREYPGPLVVGESIGYLIHKELIPGVGTGENLFYDLGAIISTAHLDDAEKVVLKQVHNRDILLCAVAINSSAFFRGSSDLQKDPELVKILLSRNGEWAWRLNTPITREMALIACTQSGDALHQEELQPFLHDRKVVLAALKSSPDAHRYLPYDLAQDDDFLREAIPIAGNMLQYASHQLMSDRRLIEKAVKNNGTAMAYVPSSMINDRELWLMAVNTVMGIHTAPDHIRDDLEIMLEAVRYNSYSFHRASKRLVGNIELIKEGLKYDGNLLRYCPNSMKNNRKLALECIKDTGMYDRLLGHLPAFHDDDEVVLASVGKDGRALEYASQRLQDDYEIVERAVTTHGPAIQYASTRLQGSKNLVLKAVGQDGSALQFVSAQFKDDPEVVSIAVTCAKYSLKHASPRLQTDPDMMIRSRLAFNQDSLDLEDDEDDYGFNDLDYSDEDDPYMQIVNGLNAQMGLPAIDMYGNPKQAGPRSTITI